MTKVAPPNSPKPPLNGGFSLIELTVSVALISVMAVAVSLALHRSQQRTGQVKFDLISQQRRADVLRTMADDFRWATEVTYPSNDALQLNIPDSAAPGGFKTILYSWNGPGSPLNCYQSGKQPIPIAEHVYDFAFEPDLFTKDEVEYQRGIDVTIQIGSDKDETEQRYFEFLNTPLW